MTASISALVGFLLLALLALYAVFLAVSMRKSSARQATNQKIGDENTKAVRENSELLRELIAINRKLLEKQERHDT